jgi:hypothetical protein
MRVEGWPSIRVKVVLSGQALDTDRLNSESLLALFDTRGQFTPLRSKT